MQHFRCLSLFLIFSLFVSYGPIQSEEVLIRTPQGCNFIVQIHPEDTFNHLQQHIDFFIQEDLKYNQVFEEEAPPTHIQEFWLDFTLFNPFKSAIPHPVNRPYKPITPQEREDIGYIVKTLANKSIPSILKLKSSLDSAGARVEHVHPYRFLEVIFTDESLKVGIRNIKKRGWIWKDFIGGVVRSMGEEANKGNLPENYLQEFTNNVGIDIEIVRPSTHNYRWEEFVSILIDRVPRSGDTGRYDM